jgi:tRNA threonylcarbamoyladenosine biosynthesis protein TsaE
MSILVGCIGANVPDRLELTSHSVEETIALGKTLGALLQAGDVICLSGDLGAGKTAFTSGIGKGWGTLEPVNSPTFVFVHEHHRAADKVKLYHLDCYRVASEEDAISIGIEDILLGDDVAILEWPERVESFLPEDRLWIELFKVDDKTRKQQFQVHGLRYSDLLAQVSKLYRH